METGKEWVKHLLRESGEAQTLLEAIKSFEDLSLSALMQAFGLGTSGTRRQLHRRFLRFLLTRINPSMNVPWDPNVDNDCSDPILTPFNCMPDAEKLNASICQSINTSSFTHDEDAAERKPKKARRDEYDRFKRKNAVEDSKATKIDDGHEEQYGKIISHYDRLISNRTQGAQRKLFEEPEEVAEDSEEFLPTCCDEPRFTPTCSCSCEPRDSLRFSSDYQGFSDCERLEMENVRARFSSTDSDKRCVPPRRSRRRFNGICVYCNKRGHQAGNCLQRLCDESKLSDHYSPESILRLMEPEPLVYCQVCKQPDVDFDNCSNCTDVREFSRNISIEIPGGSIFPTISQVLPTEVDHEIPTVEENFLPTTNIVDQDLLKIEAHLTEAECFELEDVIGDNCEERLATDTSASQQYDLPEPDLMNIDVKGLIEDYELSSDDEDIISCSYESEEVTDEWDQMGNEMPDDPLTEQWLWVQAEEVEEKLMDHGMNAKKVEAKVYEDLLTSERVEPASDRSAVELNDQCRTAAESQDELDLHGSSLEQSNPGNPSNDKKPLTTESLSDASVNVVKYCEDGGFGELREKMVEGVKSGKTVVTTSSEVSSGISKVSVSELATERDVLDSVDSRDGGVKVELDEGSDKFEGCREERFNRELTDQPKGLSGEENEGTRVRDGISEVNSDHNYYVEGVFIDEAGNLVVSGTSDCNSVNDRLVEVASDLDLVNDSRLVDFLDKLVSKISFVGLGLVFSVISCKFKGFSKNRMGVSWPKPILHSCKRECYKWFREKRVCLHSSQAGDLIS